MALASRCARLRQHLWVAVSSQDLILTNILAENYGICARVSNCARLASTHAHPTLSPERANVSPEPSTHRHTNLDPSSTHSRRDAISIPQSARLDHSHQIHSSAQARARERKDDTPEKTAEPADKLPDLSAFHEQLVFDTHGYAVPRPIHAAPPTAPSPTSERLSDSLLGMLSILQVLPEHTRTWAAHFTGYHSVDAMLELRDDLIAGTLRPPETYVAAGSTAYDLVTGSAAAHQSPAEKPQLQELLIDDGLPTLARLTDGTEVPLPHRVHSREVLATLLHLAAIERAAPDLVMEGYLLLQQDPPPPPRTMHDDEVTDYHELFSTQQRAGISGTLHRVSAVEGSDGRVTGLTVRIGRHVPAAAWPLTDVLTMIQRDSKYHRTDAGMRAVAAAAAGKAGVQDGMPCSVLVLGGPGTGKTTVLRDFSQQLSVGFGLGRRVVIVDSSNEIGGQGRIPHPAVGTARRFMVPRNRQQANVMIQALTNHNPDVIIVDELSSAADVDAARSICHRGVALVATAHATSLANLLSNHQLNPVLGGLKDVTLSREEVVQLAKEKKGSGSAGGAHAQRHAFARSVGSRTRVERRQPPCFEVVVEIVGPAAWRIHWNAAESIDALLVGEQPPSELRVMHEGRLLSRDETVDA